MGPKYPGRSCGGVDLGHGTYISGRGRLTWRLVSGVMLTNSLSSVFTGLDTAPGSCFLGSGTHCSVRLSFRKERRKPLSTFPAHAQINKSTAAAAVGDAICTRLATSNSYPILLKTLAKLLSLKGLTKRQVLQCQECRGWYFSW